MASGPLAGGTVHGQPLPRRRRRPVARHQAVRPRRPRRQRNARAATSPPPSRRRGISQVTGRLYGDESAFDSRRTGPFWKPSYWQDCPPISALSVNEDLCSPRPPAGVVEPALFAAQILKKSLQEPRRRRSPRRPRVRVHPGTRLGGRQPSRRRRCPGSSARWTSCPTTTTPRCCTKALAVHAGLRGTTANGTLTTRRQPPQPRRQAARRAASSTARACRWATI